MSNTNPTLKRWLLSFGLVLALHALLVWGALYLRPSPPPEPAPAAAVFIELAPAPIVPAKPVAAPEPVVTPQPIVPPKVVEAPKPKLVLEKPKPQPKPAPKPPAPKPEPKPEPKPVAKPAIEPVATPAPVQQAAAPNTTQTTVANQAAQKASAEALWKAQVMERLKRVHIYPEDARRRNIEGLVKVRFVVNAQGQVSSQVIVTKSGNRSLDRAALQMLRRVNPLPAPPAEILSGGQKEVVVPITFKLR